MILELKLKNGKKLVIGGDFTFCVNGNKKLSLCVNGNTMSFGDTLLKDYPTYNVGGTIVCCEEAVDD